MVVNKLRHQLDQDAWQITVVDQDDAHLYQPGLLLLPFGVYSPEELIKPRRRFIPDGVELLLGETPGMSDGQWRKSIFDFYTLDGAIALRDKLATWEGGRLVVQILPGWRDSSAARRCGPSPCLSWQRRARCCWRHRWLSRRACRAPRASAWSSAGVPLRRPWGELKPW
jgi:hypothetical protein